MASHTWVLLTTAMHKDGQVKVLLYSKHEKVLKQGVYRIIEGKFKDVYDLLNNT